MRSSTKLRSLLKEPGLIVAPGAHDPLTARLIQHEGFPCVYITGAGLSASVLGQPDLGLMTLTEVCDHAANIAAAVTVPAIADMDTGYGNIYNVTRCVKLAERIGLAGIHLEDQAYPKRCGYLAGVHVVPIEEMQEKIVAALETRTDPDFLVIARIDVKGLPDFKEAVRRAQAYELAGADMIFINGMSELSQVEEAAKAVGVPQIYNVSTSGEAPILTHDEIAAYGSYKIVIYPAYASLVNVAGTVELLREIKDTGTIKGMAHKFITFKQWNEYMGITELQQKEAEILEKAHALNGAQ